MADPGYRELIERLMAAHPAVAEALAYLASVDHAAQPPVSPAERWDHQLITSLVADGSTVLDVGCGSGELLGRLIRDKGCRGQGIERDQAAVLACVARGVPVIQRDVDHGLSGFPDAQFDYVVLEETLQVVQRPDVVLREMLRVGRVGIVSFPNFGHWWVRTQLLLEGRMPVTPRLPFSWFGSPNIHVLTIRDFETWCAEEGVTIEQAYACADGDVHPLIPADNVLAEEALFVISRPAGRALAPDPQA